MLQRYIFYTYTPNLFNEQPFFFYDPQQTKSFSVTALPLMVLQRDEQ